VEVGLVTKSPILATLTRPRAVTRPNAGQLAGSAEQDDGVVGWSGWLGPAAVVGAFEVVVAHLAFDHPGEGTQPPDREPLGQDLTDGHPDRAGELVRGKRPPGR
jgi:hypothetical protein